MTQQVQLYCITNRICQARFFQHFRPSLTRNWVTSRSSWGQPCPSLKPSTRFEARPEVMGVSMRPGDLRVDKLISEFAETAAKCGLYSQESGIRYCFGGLRPAAKLTRAMAGMPLEPDEFSPPDERHFNRGCGRGIQAKRTQGRGRLGQGQRAGRRGCAHHVGGGDRLVRRGRAPLPALRLRVAGLGHGGEQA